MPEIEDAGNTNIYTSDRIGLWTLQNLSIHYPAQHTRLCEILSLVKMQIFSSSWIFSPMNLEMLRKRCIQISSPLMSAAPSPTAPHTLKFYTQAERLSRFTLERAGGCGRMGRGG